MARRSTGPDKLTVEVVILRDRGQCAFCGKRPDGERGIGWSVHHRRPRAMGGSWREDTNSPANFVILCGSGTTGCHGWVESHRSEAYELGLLVRQNNMPSQVPIQHAVHGLCWLTDDGEAVYEVPVMSA
jgi:hypothetical protein